MIALLPILFLLVETGSQADSEIALVALAVVLLVLAAVAFQFRVHARLAAAVVPKAPAWFAMAAPTPAEAALAKALSSQQQMAL